MGCTACSQMCGNQKDSAKISNQFLQTAQQKVMFLRKAFSKPQQKNFLNEYFSDDELNIMLHLMSLEEILRPQNILLLEAGQLIYLSSTRRTLWKLYSFDILVYDYTKNSTIPPFTQDFSNMKLSQKTQSRFYEIGLDINRTFPTIKHLNRSHLALVLKNLTLYFDGVGYTQGMNFVVGFMLLCGFEPKQAYWLFIHLSYNQNFLLVRNFTEGFKNVLFMIKVFQEFMEKDIELLKIKGKIDEMGLTSFFYSFSWFLCYFLYSLQPKVCALIWDFALTFDSKKLTNGKGVKLQIQTQKGIKQKSELESEIKLRHQTFPEYFQIVQNQRGSILNLMYLGFELMKHLSDYINESESAEQLLKILRNENLAQLITPQMIVQMIERIRRGKTIEEKLEKKLDWRHFVQRMKEEDKELYQIETSQSRHRKFVEQCLGLRRSKF